MNLTKNWWQSKTLWINIVAFLFGALAFFKVGIPADVDQATVVEAIMSIVAVINFVLRLFTSHAIAPTPTN